MAIDRGTPTSSRLRLGSPVMTVRAEKSTRFPIKLPRKRPSFPLRRSRMALMGRPPFCLACGTPAKLLSMYVAMWYYWSWKILSAIRVQTSCQHESDAPYLEQLHVTIGHITGTSLLLAFLNRRIRLDDISQLVGQIILCRRLSRRRDRWSNRGRRDGQDRENHPIRSSELGVQTEPLHVRWRNFLQDRMYLLRCHWSSLSYGRGVILFTVEREHGREHPSDTKEDTKQR